MLVSESRFDLVIDIGVVAVLAAYDFDFFEFGFEFFGVVYSAEVDVEFGGAFVAGFGTEEV